MKTKSVLISLLLISLFIITSIVSADGNAPSWNTQKQQSYPIPQLYPIGPNPQQNQPQQPQWQPNPPQQNPPQQQEQGFYDPWSGLYFYHIEENKPQQQYQPYQPYYPVQPYYPNNQYTPYPQYQPYTPYMPYNPGSGYSDVQISKQWKNNGSINLTWIITNITNEFWDRKNIDIKCTSGCHLLTKPERTLWDIPYSVNRGDQLSFTVNIWRPLYGETMTFAIVAGSKTLYTFSVNPN